MTTLNLTQHPATPEQISAGVIDLHGADRAALTELLTFDNLPTWAEVVERATAIAAIAANNVSAEDRADGSAGFALAAMIGGAPYLMAPLERALRSVGIEPMYSFSVRESTETVQPDGSVRKTNIFRHGGFVPG